jgi:hypothetical protein
MIFHNLIKTLFWPLKKLKRIKLQLIIKLKQIELRQRLKPHKIKLMRPKLLLIRLRQIG